MGMNFMAAPAIRQAAPRQLPMGQYQGINLAEQNRQIDPKQIAADKEKNAYMDVLAGPNSTMQDRVSAYNGLIQVDPNAKNRVMNPYDPANAQRFANAANQNTALPFNPFIGQKFGGGLTNLTNVASGNNPAGSAPPQYQDWQALKRRADQDNGLQTLNQFAPTTGGPSVGAFGNPISASGGVSSVKGSQPPSPQQLGQGLQQQAVMQRQMPIQQQMQRPQGDMAERGLGGRSMGSFVGSRRY